ncbi:MAG TPA: hypothetical protein VFN65_02895 [Solirubrobacteraceae bacterium]|nr:hypothetical protein [Solirubrobacteraceae bacterium]
MAGQLEERTVEVNLPDLSPEINERLTSELRDIIGADRVRVPADRPHPSRGERPRGGPLKRMTTVKAMVIGLLAVAAGVALVVVTALGGEWILTALAFVVLLLSLTVVTMSIIALSSVPEYPDASLVALLAEQGISDPEVRFSEIVMEFTPETGDDEERPTDVRDDPARAIAEQQEALTATSGPTESGAEG